MALGDQYNNNKKNYQPTVYSQYSLSNAQSELDPTKLAIRYWNNLLVFSIYPKIENSDVENPRWDFQNGISIYLSPFKALMFEKELIDFLKNPDTYNNRGVETSSGGLITISNGKDFNISSPLLMIRKTDSTGHVESSFAYQIRSKYFKSIRNFDEKEPEKTQIQYYDSIEIESLILILDQYTKAMSGAGAYAVIDNSKYDNSRINTKIGLIADKLGVEFKKNGGNKSSNSFFSKLGNGSSNSNDSKPESNFTPASLDDIDNMID